MASCVEALKNCTRCALFMSALTIIYVWSGLHRVLFNWVQDNIAPYSLTVHNGPNDPSLQLVIYFDIRDMASLSILDSSLDKIQAKDPAKLIIMGIDTVEHGDYGRLLKDHARVFYWYASDVNSSLEQAGEVDNITRTLEDDHSWARIDEFLNILDCRLAKISTSTMLRAFSSTPDWLSASLPYYSDCLAKEFQNKTQTVSNALELCLPIAVKACQQSKLRALEIPGFPPDWIPMLASRDLSVRFI